MSPSIRWRLTFWNALALSIVLLGLGIIVQLLLNHAREHTEHAIRQRIDRALERIDRALTSAFKLATEDPLVAANPRRRLSHWFEEFQEQEQEKIFGVAYDRAGRIIEKSPELTGDRLPPPPRVAPVSLVLSDVVLPRLGRHRSLTGPLRSGAEPFTLVLVSSLTEVDRERREVVAELEEVDAEHSLLTTVLVASLPAALLIIAGLGYWLARKALAPLDQLNRQTEQISADRLDRRLPVANPDDELGRLAQTINAMIGRLERSFLEVHRFTADASHELRTPLTAMRTETEVALRRSPTDAEYRQLLESILEEIDRLTRLTDQLLSLSREDARPDHAQADGIEIAKLVYGVAENMRPLAVARGVELIAHGNGAIQVRGDEPRLRQVFYNLLDNAVKYTPPGGTIEVRLSRDAGAAVIVVRDTGIGIPAEHLPRVFERFYRVDKARSRAEGGTGLGLSIAKSIVESHGGRIEMSSSPGQGTTCTVILPEDEKQGN
jgi:heavy metal sensor kinase